MMFLVEPSLATAENSPVGSPPDFNVVAVCRDKLSTAETLVLVLGGKVHVDPDQGSTLHEQGVPEVELVDPEEGDKEKCASIYSGLLS